MNDLERHKRSFHRFDLASYRCAADGCLGKEKVWPRLDNFTQHIARMHREEDMHDLIKRYVCNTKPEKLQANNTRSKCQPPTYLVPGSSMTLDPESSLVSRPEVFHEPASFHGLGSLDLIWRYDRSPLTPSLYSYHLPHPQDYSDPAQIPHFTDSFRVHR